MKIKPIFAWYDFWVGIYWDRKSRKLYLLPLPMVGLVIDFSKEEIEPKINLWETGPGIKSKERLPKDVEQL